MSPVRLSSSISQSTWLDHGHAAMMMVESDYYQHFSVSRNVFSSAPASKIKPLIASYAWDSTPLLAVMTDIEDSRFPVQPPGLLDLVKSFKQAPTVIYQPTSERGGELGKEVMFWAPILGLLLSPITGVGMLILGWLGHHRRRREEILLQLQITKINLENDNLSLVNEKLRLELALAQQEADKPRLISG